MWPSKKVHILLQEGRLPWANTVLVVDLGGVGLDSQGSMEPLFGQDLLYKEVLQVIRLNGTPLKELI